VDNLRQLTVATRSTQIFMSRTSAYLGAALDHLNVSRANTGSNPLAFTDTLDITLLGYGNNTDLLGSGTKQPGGVAQIPSGILVAQNR